MKKISYLELSSIVLTIIISFNLGINLYILKNNTGINSWISIIIAYLIGFIPLILTIYISNYHPSLTIYEKNIALFGKTIGYIINIIISFILFVIAITILYNVISFTTTQFLYHTPMLISAILLVALATYAATKEINVISHVSLLLITINLIIFIISTLSLTKEIHLDYLLPILKTDQSNIIPASLKIAIINTLPLLIIQIIPKANITNQKKYSKSIIISYIIGMLISFIITTGTISALGIYLTKTFEYAEYIVLKKIKLFGFLERIENISSIQWITESFIYLTLIIYSIAKSITHKKDDTKEELNYHKVDISKKRFIYTCIIIGIVIIITNKYLFTSITKFNNYLETTFIYIVSLLMPIYFIISIKILIKKHKLIK